VLEIRDGGKAVLSLQNAKPGDSATGCLLVRYNRSEPAEVRLYGKTSGTGFDRYLDLRVTRGSSCVRANVVVYKGTLARFPDGPEGAIEETWSPGEAHVYRFGIKVRDDNTAQGLTARQTFTWITRGDVEPTPPGRTEVPGPLARPPGVDGLRRVLERIARVAAEVGKRSAFPTGLLLLVGVFLSLQNRIDRRDPKLALAPVHPTPDLPFDDDHGGSE
jgi:hypothetical protein